MPSPTRTRRPRLLPAALLASALVVSAAGGVLAATGGGPDAPTADACSAGSEFVTVRPVFDDAEWRPARPAAPPLAGCLDTSRIDRPGDPAPTNPRG
ncbi:MAG TPA: hypothetical protein VE547_00265 [Mycobacteriales bacterium]|nr:hypothetical protein [Mycobacteriales bacterium]